MELLVGRMNVLFITHPIQTIKNLLIVITVLPVSGLAVNSSIPTKLTNQRRARIMQRVSSNLLKKKALARNRLQALSKKARCGSPPYNHQPVHFGSNTQLSTEIVVPRKERNATTELPAVMQAAGSNIHRSAEMELIAIISTVLCITHPTQIALNLPPANTALPAHALIANSGIQTNLSNQMTRMAVSG